MFEPSSINRNTSNTMNAPVSSAPVAPIRLLLLAAGTLSLQAQLLTLGNYGGHDYYYDPMPYTSQDAAKAEAAAQGLMLVSITSEPENDFLEAVIAPIAPAQLRAAWIGLSRTTSSDPWAWSSGEPFGYANWRPAGILVGFPEPTGEEAGVMYVNDGSAIGYWADTYGSGTEPFNAIYESVPEPFDYALISGLGLGAFAAFRRRAPR